LITSSGEELTSAGLPANTTLKKSLPNGTPDPGEIPDLAPPKPYLGFSAQTPNSHFYRDTARYEHFRRIYRPVRIAAWNIGEVALNDVRIEIFVEAGTNVRLAEAAVSAPVREWSVSSIYMPATWPVFPRPGYVEIEERPRGSGALIDAGNIQPGRTAVSEQKCNC
jgi:hypothetical protein